MIPVLTESNIPLHDQAPRSISLMGARMGLDSRQPAFCFRLPPAGFELHPPKIPLNQQENRHWSTWSCKPIQATTPDFQPNPAPSRPSETCPEASNSLAPLSASSLAPHLDGFHQPKQPTRAIPTVIPSSPLKAHRNKHHHHRSSTSIIPRLPPNKQPPNPAPRTEYVQLISLSNNNSPVVPQQHACVPRCCMSHPASLLPAYASSHPPPYHQQHSVTETEARHDAPAADSPTRRRRRLLPSLFLLITRSTRAGEGGGCNHPSCLHLLGLLRDLLTAASR